jgi:hypothetical protein
VTAEDSTEPGFTDIDKALSAWRQGDCVLGSQWFVHRMAPERPSTQAGRETAKLDATADLVEQQVVGLVVVTQTCDVVRACADRPFLEVCPLVEVDEQRLGEIERERRPSYAYVPLLAGRKLVADLDRTMTVEKPVVAKWERTPGWRTDAEARAFAKALARKRARFAFPDDFTALMGKLQSRLIEKHGKDTPEGGALRALREIRVQASPSWDAAAVTLTFWFIRYDDQVEWLGSSWSHWAETWLKLVPESRRFTKVLGQVAALEDLTAADYVNSDPLDLDHLSSRTPKN